MSGGTWNAASLVLPLASTLVLSVVISRRLGPDLLGEQSLIAYAQSVLFSLAVLSLTSASVQLLSAAEGAGEGARAAHLARWSSRAHLVGGVFSGLGLVVVALQREQLQGAWLLAGISVLLDALGWALAARVIARDGWGAVGKRRLVAQGLAPLLGVAFVLLGFGVVGVLAAQAAVSAGLLLSVRRLCSTLPSLPRTRATRPAWQPVARLWGMFVLTATVSQVVDRRVEFLFLERYGLPRDLAMYSVAFNVVGLGVSVCTALISSAVPAIAAADAAGQQARVAKGLAHAQRVLLAVSMLSASAVAVLGPPTVRLVYGQQFADAARLTPVLALSLLAAPVGHLCAVYWTGIGSLRPVLLSGGAAGVLDLALARLLVPDHGAMGAVVANVAAQVLAATLLVWHTWHRGLGARVDRRAWLSVLVVALLAGASGQVAITLLPGWIGLLSGIAGFLLVVLAGARTVGVLAVDDLAWVAGSLPPRLGARLTRLSRTGHRTR